MSHQNSMTPKCLLVLFSLCPIAWVRPGDQPTLLAPAEPPGHFSIERTPCQGASFPVRSPGRPWWSQSSQALPGTSPGTSGCFLP